MKEQLKPLQLKDFDFSNRKGGGPGNETEAMTIVSTHLNKQFVKSPDGNKQKLFINLGEKISLYCLYSKENKNINTSQQESYFTFREHQRLGLAGFQKNYLALILADTSRILLFDTDEFLNYLGRNNCKRTDQKGIRWDFHFLRGATNRIKLKETNLDVTGKLIPQ